MLSMSHCHMLHRNQRFADCTASSSVTGKSVQPQAQEILCKQQAVGDLLCNASCLQFNAALHSLVLHLVAALFCHRSWAFRGMASYLISA